MLIYCLVGAVKGYSINVCSRVVIVHVGLLVLCCKLTILCNHKALPVCFEMVYSSGEFEKNLVSENYSWVGQIKIKQLFCK